MKKINLAFFSILLLSLGLARAEEQSVEVVQETISLPMADAAKVLAQNLSDDQFYKSLIKAVEKEAARLETFTAIRTQSGLSVRSISASEYIYPTEFEPAEMPNTIGGGQVALTKDGPTPLTGSGKSALPSLVVPVTPATPATFDTRFLGNILETEVLITEDKKRVVVSLVADKTRLLGLDGWGEGIAETFSPRFSLQRVQTTVTTKDGRPVLVGTQSPAPEVQGAEKRVWFSFVTCHLIDVKKP